MNPERQARTAVAQAKAVRALIEFMEPNRLRRYRDDAEFLTRRFLARLTRGKPLTKPMLEHLSELGVEILSDPDWRPTARSHSAWPSEWGDIGWLPCRDALAAANVDLGAVSTPRVLAHLTCGDREGLDKATERCRCEQQV